MTLPKQSARGRKVPKLPDVRFTHENASEYSRVFLWENISEPPFMRAVEGWGIVGYGKAPWPGSTEGFAVMFEKVTPAEKQGVFGKHEKTFGAGVRIWQHGREEWVPGLPGHEARLDRIPPPASGKRGGGRK